MSMLHLKHKMELDKLQTEIYEQVKNKQNEIGEHIGPLIAD